MAKPSYFLMPTVWIVVAVTRGSAATSSLKRRTPCTASSALSAWMTAPSRTTLSTTISDPGRDSRSDQRKYSGIDALSASMCYDPGASQLVIPMNANNALAFIPIK